MIRNAPRRPVLLASFALIVAGILTVAAAEAQSLVYGGLSGVVRDTAGRPIGDAEVRITDRSSGAERAIITARDGSFSVAFLSPAAYDVTVEGLGYRPLIQQAVAVRAGGVTMLNLALRAASPPVVAVDTVRGGALRPAPFAWLGERGYTELVGRRRLASDAAALAVRSDDRSVEGLSWRYTDLVVDGAMVNGTGAAGVAGRAGAGLSVPLAAVADASAGGFDFDAEIGGAGVGVSALSRRGGDRPRRGGAAFGGTSDIGGALRLDGPLQRDTAHAIIGLDYQRSQVARPVAILGGDTEGLALLQTARDDFGTNLDALAAESNMIEERASAFGRLDWDLADRFSIAARAAGSRVVTSDPAFADLAPAGLGSRAEATGVQASLNIRTRVSPRVTSELRFSGDLVDASARPPLVATTAFAGRGLVVGGAGVEPFAERRFAPRLNALVHFDLGRHRLKLGALFASHRAETEGAEGSAGTFAFGDAVDLTALSGSYRAVDGSTRSGNFRMRETALTIQDAWRVADGLDVTLGLRLDAQKLPTGEITTNAAWLAASGLDNALIRRTRSELAPRFGVRWELGTGREWTIEGGAGIFHDLPDHLVVGEALARDAGQTVRLGAGTLSSWPTAPDLASAPEAGTTLSMLGSGFEGPRTRRASLSLSRNRGGWTTYVSGTYRFTDFLNRRSDLNLPAAPLGTDQYGRPLYGGLMQLGTLLTAVPGSNRRFGAFDAVHGLDVTGFSEYRAIIVGVERALDAGLSLGLRYAYSTTGDNLVEGGGAALDPVPGVSSQEWSDGTSDFDAPHRLMAAADWALGPTGAVRFGVIYHLASGAPFTASFREGIDANADGVSAGDPAFVDPALPGMAALIAEWACLEKDAGGFARRNGCRGDLVHRVDLRATFRLRSGAGGPIELVLDALDLASAARPVVDRALVLVDRTGTLTTNAGTGVTTVPLVANPNFGGILADRSPGPLFRLGLRIGR